MDEWTIYVCPECGHWNGSSYFEWPHDTPPRCKIKGYGRDGKRSCGAEMEAVQVVPKRYVEGVDEVLDQIEAVLRRVTPTPPSGIGVADAITALERLRAR